MEFTIKEILKNLVTPALGCTEIVAIALASSNAASLIDRNHIEKINLVLSRDVFKNVRGVIVPKTGNLKGPAVASALGAIAGDPSLRMEVLSPINEQHIEKAISLVKNNKVDVDIDPKIRGLYVKAAITSHGHVSQCVIKDYQDRVIYLKIDGKDCISKDTKKIENIKISILKWIKTLPFEKISNLLDSIDQEDLHYLKKSTETNLKLAEYGLSNKVGMGVGNGLKKLGEEKFLIKDPVWQAKVFTGSATDARMAGADLPATSSAGSGNNGLVATIPVWLIGKYFCVEEEKILKGIAFSHLITAKVKSYMGQLSYMCSCSIAAGAGACSGITYIMDGSLTQIEGAILNTIEDLTGVICDGAKPSCSIKLVTAVQSAYQNAILSLKGIRIPYGEGIVGDNLQDTLYNLEKLNTSGESVDNSILSILKG